RRPGGRPGDAAPATLPAEGAGVRVGAERRPVRPPLRPARVRGAGGRQRPWPPGAAVGRGATGGAGGAVARVVVRDGGGARPRALRGVRVADSGGTAHPAPVRRRSDDGRRGVTHGAACRGRGGNSPASQPGVTSGGASPNGGHRRLPG